MKKNKINNASNENNKIETNETNFIEVGKNINNENINNDFSNSDQNNEYDKISEKDFLYLIKNCNDIKISNFKQRIEDKGIIKDTKKYEIERIIKHFSGFIEGEVIVDNKKYKDGWTHTGTNEKYATKEELSILETKLTNRIDNVETKLTNRIDNLEKELKFEINELKTNVSEMKNNIEKIVQKLSI